MTLSIYDGVMLAIVVFAVIHGAMKGMAWQLAPIASLVLGYLFAVPLSAATAPWFGEPPLNRVFAMITMYMVVSLGVYLVARSLRDSLEKTKLLEFDRHLGALLGGVKGVLFTVVLTVALLSVSPSAATLIVKSESHTIAEHVVNIICPLLPADVHQVIDPYLKPIHDHANDEALPLVDELSPRRQQQDVAQHEDDTFAPRRRGHQPIFEDDPSADDSESPNPVAPRRRPRSTDDDVNPDFQPTEDDTGFGTDPNALDANQRPPRLR